MIKLECKHKQGAYIYKQSARLTTEEVRNILAGNYEILRERKEEVCQTFYYECVTNFLRPRVIVDYESHLPPSIISPLEVRFIDRLLIIFWNTREAADPSLLL